MKNQTQSSNAPTVQTMTLDTVDSIKLITLKTFSEKNGSLTPITANKEIPISIKRVFYILNVNQGETRGEHAHFQCSQVLVCPIGKCEIRCDDGKEEKTFVLDAPNKALFVPPSIWMSQKYIIESSMLMVLTDEEFQEKDYIRDYNDFMKYRGFGLSKAS